MVMHILSGMDCIDLSSLVEIQKQFAPGGMFYFYHPPFL